MIGRRPQFDRPYSEKACRACVPCAQRSKNVRWEHRRPSPDLQTDEVLTHGKKANFCLRNYKPFTFLGGNVYLVGCGGEVQPLHCSSKIGLSATLRKEVAAVPLLFPHCRCLSLSLSVGVTTVSTFQSSSLLQSSFRSEPPTQSWCCWRFCYCRAAAARR